MKLALFNDYRLGVVRGDRIVDVMGEVASVPYVKPHDLMSGVIARFDEFRERLEQAAARLEGEPVDSVRIRPPLPGPNNFVCMASNYREGGARQALPDLNAFAKPSSSVIGHGDDIVLPDVPALVFEGEAEVAVVFGKEGKNVSEEDAFDHVFGYTNFIDGSARGLGPERNVYFQMKSRDTFAPIGPYIVTADEIPDPQNLTVRLWNNGELRQHYSTSDMAYPIARCIAWLTSVHTLFPGDILGTGTNHTGLHAFQDGDVVEMEAAGMGRLRVGVRDQVKRAWSRETRREREQAGFSGRRDLFAPQVGGKYAPG